MTSALTTASFLQSQVHAIVGKKRQRDQAEREESLRIALANPLVEKENPTQVVAREAIQVADKKAHIRTLPFPLTEGILLAAYSELQSGAAIAVRSCVHCWRRNALANDDLLSTVRGLASSSPALQKAFKAEPEPESEVASAEDFAALAQLSREGSFKSTIPMGMAQ